MQKPENRVEVVLDLVFALARLGSKNERIEIKLSPAEFVRWRTDAQKVPRLVEHAATTDEFHIYGPSGMLVHVGVRR